MSSSLLYAPVLVALGYLLYLTEHKPSLAWKVLALIPFSFSAYWMTLGFVSYGALGLLIAFLALAWGAALWQEKYLAAALMGLGYIGGLSRTLLSMALTRDAGRIMVLLMQVMLAAVAIRLAVKGYHEHRVGREVESNEGHPERSRESS